ncbi:hypothetical protein [Paracoccus salsus]|uniref:hypothetical protein n=1 Tax=Paracoccus salsus TaxID=2911061 RepID=UPI001F45112E|nr:hypothetical protein [Paracoccus salsus]MCF3974366.1 hypothetical protein [Paracoccus salsus]
MNWQKVDDPPKRVTQHHLCDNPGLRAFRNRRDQNDIGQLMRSGGLFDRDDMAFGMQPCLTQPIFELGIGNIQVGCEFRRLSIDAWRRREVDPDPFRIKPNPARPGDKGSAIVAQRDPDFAKQLADTGIAVFGVAFAEQQVLKPRAGHAHALGTAQYRKRPAGTHATRCQDDS